MANLGTIKSVTLSNGDTATFTIPLYTGTGTVGQAGSKTVDYIPSLWTFDIGYTPVAGDIIVVKVPVAGVSSGVWMSVNNGTTYYPVATVNKTRFTTQYPVDGMVLLLYEPNATTTTYGTTKDGAPANSSAADLVSNRWTVVNGYDSDTTYNAMTSANMIAGTETTVRGMRADYLKTGLQGIIKVTNGDVQLYGTHLTGQVPAVTASDNGKMLQVSNGEWEAIETAIIGDINSVPIASFSDAVPTNALDVTIDIEPVQDFHGYDNPWPAGGNINLFPPFTNDSKNGVTLTQDADGTVTLNGTASEDTFFDVNTSFSYSAGTPYFFYGFNPVASDSNKVSLFASGNNSTPQVNLNSANAVFARSSAQVTADNTITKFRVRAPQGVQLTNFKFKPMFQLGGIQQTAWYPYSNICPITGWTGANVSRTGVNVWDEQSENGSFDTTTGAKKNDSSLNRSKNPIPVLPETTYYQLRETGSGRIFYYDSSMNFLDSVYSTRGEEFTTPANCYFINFTLAASKWGTPISINYPSTDNDYHAYVGTTYSITFPTEAGTVYGGTLDVTTGLLTVDRVEVTYDGSSDEQWFRYASGSASSYCMGIMPPLASTPRTAKLIANYLQTISVSATWGNYDCFISAGTNTDGVFVATGIRSITTVEDWRTYLSNNPLQVCYGLATPITYQLTPTQVALLAGENNVWADTGNIFIKYRRQDSLGINENITPNYIGAKEIQNAVADPTASGNAISFIDSISQNAQGVITPTKKTVPEASQSDAGLMSSSDKTKLDGIDIVNDLTNNDSTKVASQKEAYDLYAMFAHSVYASSDVFTAQSGGTIKTNYSFATKMANVCYLQLNVTAASSASLVIVAELKGGFIPYNKNIFTMAIDESDNSTREVLINTSNGQVGIYSAVSGHTYNISVTYVT